MEKRWISLYVMNDVGVLAKIAGLFSGKCYNLDSLTVGTTEDPTVSRMTIGLYGDENTFEQIKKQLNRFVEVIKVIDFTNASIHMKEILFVKVKHCSKEEKEEVFKIAKVFGLTISDYGPDSVLVECVQRKERNDDMIHLLQETFTQIEVVRGGSVGIESISLTGRE
ncbi:acetolactate synthase small subunit [Lachnospiraceae bacterium KM106-2]|nr:acetolactate synthase small subunit [Lachnospiraceae bacterium KM106-2]